MNRLVNSLVQFALLCALAWPVLGAAPGHPHLVPYQHRSTRTGDVGPTAARSGLSIINDDYQRARAEANKRKLPLFVEVWAPW